MTTHTSDESNNSMHAPDMHTERGYNKGGRKSVFKVSVSRAPLVFFSATLPPCNQLPSSLELRVFKCNCSGRSQNAPTTDKQVTTRLKAVWVVLERKLVFPLLTK